MKQVEISTEQFLQNFHDLLEDTHRDLITLETEFKSLVEWDSMMALMLIAMFDEHYEVKLNGDMITQAATLADLYKFAHK